MSPQLTHTNFDNFYLSEGMLATLATVGYKVPTPVQTASIPLVMAGIDLIVQSQTGTGKTAAFAIPIVEMLSHNPGTIEVLFLAPTRELAKQVSDEFARFANFKNIEVATVYGGTGYEAQQKALETAQIVVATPGRLLDLVNRGDADLGNLRLFGLDEADEMLSMGFAEEVDAIIARLPDERQSLLFSATITEDVKALAKSMLYYPEFVTLSSDSVAANDVSHEFFPVSGIGRLRDLLKVIEFEQPENAIIFANTRGDTFAVTKFLKRHGLRADVLNGDLPQKERERTLGLLRKGEIDFLVATDVAARGIDISELSHVINYVIPESAEVYVHRTGRTGRAGSRGVALSLISPREMATLFNIRKLYGIEVQKRPMPTPAEILEARRQRRLQALDAKLDKSGLPYGAALGLAQQLVEHGNDPESLRLLARLIALADKVVHDGLDDVELRPSAPPASAEPKLEDVEADEAEADEVEADEESAPEPVAAKAEPRQERRAPRAEATPAEEAPERAGETESNGTDAGGQHRRRRRRRDGEAVEEAAAAPEPAEKKAAERTAPAPARDDEKDEDRRSGRSRRNRRGRGRDRDREREREPERSRETGRLPERPKAPAPAAPAPVEMSKIWVNIGRNQVEAPEGIVEMVCYMAGMDPEDVGNVTLESSYSYVEVRDDYFYDIIAAMNNQDWNGVVVSAEPARK